MWVKFDMIDTGDMPVLQAQSFNTLIFLMSDTVKYALLSANTGNIALLMSEMPKSVKCLKNKFLENKSRYSAFLRNPCIPTPSSWK